MSLIFFFGSYRISKIAKLSAQEDTKREKRGSHFKVIESLDLKAFF